MYIYYFEKIALIYIYTKYVWTFNEYTGILFISKSWDKIVGLWLLSPHLKPNKSNSVRQFIKCVQTS